MPSRTPTSLLLAMIGTAGRPASSIGCGNCSTIQHGPAPRRRSTASSSYFTRRSPGRLRTRRALWRPPWGSFGSNHVGASTSKNSDFGGRGVVDPPGLGDRGGGRANHQQAAVGAEVHLAGCFDYFRCRRRNRWRDLALDLAALPDHRPEDVSRSVRNLARRTRIHLERPCYRAGRAADPDHDLDLSGTALDLD